MIDTFLFGKNVCYITISITFCHFRRRQKPPMIKAIPHPTFSDNMRNEEAYNKGIYGYPLKVNDVYWSRTEGGHGSGENEYASIQENLPPGSIHSPASDDPHRNMVPLPYPDVSSMSTYKGQSGKHNNNPSPVPNISPDSAELREYYVLDPDSVKHQKDTMARMQPTQR